MPIQNEGLVLGDGLKDELRGDMSRSTETIVSGAGSLPIFRVLGRITASGKLTNYTPGAADGSEVASAILITPTDATAADAKAPVVDWTALFAYNRLSWGAAVTTLAHRNTALAQLRNRGIKTLIQA